MKKKSILRNIIITLLALVAACVISFIFQRLEVQEHITTIFVFSVFIVSLFTDGYFYGIFSSVVSPIIVLSARNNDTDKVLALDAGANDYVTKPFSSAELLARIRMVLRNYQHRADSGKLPIGTFRTKDLLIQYDARQVFVHGQEVGLSQTEYNIVAFLSEHCGKMMTYSAIIKEIWGYPDEGSTKRLQVNMANIRRKFGVKPGEAWCISNELGVGYRMNGDNEE